MTQGSDEAGRSSGEALWAGRFASPPAPEAHALGRSVQFDVRLAPHDVDAVRRARPRRCSGPGC